MRKFLVGLVVVLCIAIPLGVLAANSDTTTGGTVKGPGGTIAFANSDTTTGGTVKGPGGTIALKLTDEQKAKLEDAFKQMTETKKEIINEMVQSGEITQDQAEALLNRLDEMLENIEENGWTPGFGFGMRKGRGKGSGGPFGIDIANLTEEQKADLVEYFKKMAELKKEAINRMIENGTITKEQGDAAIKRIDEMIENCEENGWFGGFGMRKGYGYGHGRGRGNCIYNTATSN